MPYTLRRPYPSFPGESPEAAAYANGRLEVLLQRGYLQVQVTSCVTVRRRAEVTPHGATFYADPHDAKRLAAIFSQQEEVPLRFSHGSSGPSFSEEVYVMERPPLLLREAPSSVGENPQDLLPPQDR